MSRVGFLGFCAGEGGEGKHEAPRKETLLTRKLPGKTEEMRVIWLERVVVLNIVLIIYFRN